MDTEDAPSEGEAKGAQPAGRTRAQWQGPRGYGEERVNEGERHWGKRLPSAPPPAPTASSCPLEFTVTCSAGLLFVHAALEGQEPLRGGKPLQIPSKQTEGLVPGDVGGAGKVECPHQEAVVMPPDARRRAGLA